MAGARNRTSCGFSEPVRCEMEHQVSSGEDVLLYDARGEMLPLAHHYLPGDVGAWVGWSAMHLPRQMLGRAVGDYLVIAWREAPLL